MEKISIVQNVGIYLDVRDEKRRHILADRLRRQMDGFAEYYQGKPEQYRVIVKDLMELEIPDGAVSVPDNAYFKCGLFYSIEAKVAFRETDEGMIFWTDENVWYLPYMLEYIWERQGATFVHGAAVSKDGEGFLLVAFGGIGKTCFISEAVKQKSVKILGDDLIILNREGNLYSFPRPFCLYEYHKGLFPEYFKGKKFHFEELRPDRYILRIMRKLKKELHIKDTIIYDYLPVSPIHLFAREKVETESVPVKKIFLVRRIKGLTKVNTRPFTDIEQAVNFAHDVIQHEWSVGVRLEFNYLAHKGEAYTSRAQKQYDIILSAFQRAGHIAQVDIPENMSAEEVSKALYKIVLNNS